MVYLVLLILLAFSAPSFAAEFAVVQDTARTTAGTKSYTSSGFGTPKGALLFVTSATATGTTTDHALFGIGMADDTSDVTLSGRSKNGIALGTSLAGGRGDNNDCLLLADQDATVILRATCAMVTDGVELNFATAPASALLISVLLIGGTNVSDVHVGTFQAPATQDTGIDVTAPNFTSAFVITACYGDFAIDDTNDASAAVSIGFAANDGASPPGQFGVQWYEVSGVATTSTIQSIEQNTVAREIANSVGQEVEINTFDSQGFTATTRSAAGTTDCGYMAVATSLSVKVMALDTPTSTGSQSWTGIGFTPQAGILLQSGLSAYDNRGTTGSSETWGIGMMTSTAQASMGITADDGVTTTTNAESVTHTRPIFLRKDEATYMDATFTSFGSGSVTLNFATTDTLSVRKWAGLFISQPTATRRPGKPILTD